MDFSDNTTRIFYFATISGLSLSSLGLILFAIRECNNFTVSNRHRYQFFAIGLQLFFLIAVAAKLINLIISDKIDALDLVSQIADFVAITFSVLAETEILRLLQVILPFSMRQIFAFQIFALIYSFATGGYRLISWLPLVTDQYSNFLRKWNAWGAYAWYGGVGFYVLIQSAYVTYMMYRQYSQIAMAKRDVIRIQCIKVWVGLFSMLILFLFGMVIMMFGNTMEKSTKTNTASIGRYLASINACIKAFIAFIYPTVFENIKGFCLSKSSIVMSSKKKESKIKRGFTK